MMLPNQSRPPTKVKTLIKILVSLCLMLLLLLGVLLAAYWQPDRSVDELSRWQLPESRWVTLKGMQVHYTDTGSKDGQNVTKAATPQPAAQTTLQQTAPSTVPSSPPTLLLLHGTSSSLHTWQGWVAEFTDHYRVVRVDMPGFGLTGPDPQARYRPEDYVAFVIALMDALEIEQATLVGNSLGGKVAWLTAATHPKRVDKLVLIDAVGFVAEDVEEPIGFKLAQVPLLDPVLQRVLPRPLIEKSLLNVYANDSKVTDELVDRYFELTLRAGNRAALSERFRQFDAASHQSLLASVSQPTLILWGGKDKLNPVINAYRFDAIIPNSQLVVLPDTGHTGQEEDPKQTAQLTRQFLLSPAAGKQASAP